MEKASRPSCRLLSSWPVDSGVGSGVVAAAKGIHRALMAKGLDPEFISPPYRSGGYLSTTARRIFYNLALNSDSRVGDSKTPLITFDFDGFFFLPA